MNVYLVVMKRITLSAFLFSIAIVFSACFDEDSGSPTKSEEQIEANTDSADTNNKENDGTVNKNGAVGKSIQELKRMFDDKSVSYSHRLDSAVNEDDGTISYFAPVIQKMCVTPRDENDYKNAVLEKDIVISETSIAKARYEVFNDSLILFPRMYAFADYATQGELYVSDNNDGIYGTWYETGCSGGRHSSKFICNDDEKDSYTYLKLDIAKDYIEVDGRHVVGGSYGYCGDCDKHVAYTTVFQSLVKFMEDSVNYYLEPTLGDAGYPTLPSWATFTDLDTVALIEYAERTVSVKQIVEVESEIKLSLTVSSGDVSCSATSYIYDTERIPDELCEDSRPRDVSGIDKHVYTTFNYTFSSKGVSYYYVSALIYTPVDEKKKFNDCLDKIRQEYQKEPKFKE